LADGVLSTFKNNGNNAVDRNDALKINNFSEQLGIARKNKILSVEQRKQIGKTDTIFYNTQRLLNKSYVLEFVPEGLFNRGLSAIFEDSHTGKKTNVDMDNPTEITFTGDAVSENRFRLIFSEGKARDNSALPFGVDGKPAIVVYPNPVAGDVINLRMQDAPTGLYIVKLLNGWRQQITSVRIRHDEATTTEAVPLKKSLAKGNYYLEIIKPDKRVVRIGVTKL
jgi:hypothetical protein